MDALNIFEELAQEASVTNRRPEGPRYCGGGTGVGCGAVVVGVPVAYWLSREDIWLCAECFGRMKGADGREESSE